MSAAEGLASHQFAALAPGPRLLAMGALHGNEYAGALGCARVIAALEAEPSLLRRGSVTLLPVANPVAYAERVRYQTVNPNRIFGQHAAPTLYEERLVTRLCDFIDACDILLDLHTYVAPPSVPFAFADRADDIDFAAALQTPYVLTGWAELVGGATDSTGYAHQQGKPAVTLECGQQDDPAAVVTAEAGIWRALRHWGLIDAVPPQLSEGTVSRRLTFHTRIVKERDGMLAPGLRHLNRVAAGQVLARYADGAILTAAKDCHIVMPKPDARLGDEWYYLAS